MSKFDDTIQSKTVAAREVEHRFFVVCLGNIHTKIIDQQDNQLLLEHGFLAFAD